MKKIMFNDKFLLTQAVLRREKTQTRRIVKDGTQLGDFEETMKYAPYKVGEVVAVAQCYLDIGSPQFDKFGYDVSGNTNKMFVKAELMPHKIKITNVRIERLQDISDEDCLREGISHYTPADAQNTESGFGFQSYKGGLYLYNTARDAFAALIDKVSGKGTWESNTYVWVYDFELVE